MFRDDFVLGEGVGVRGVGLFRGVWGDWCGFICIRPSIHPWACIHSHAYTSIHPPNTTSNHHTPRHCLHEGTVHILRQARVPLVPAVLLLLGLRGGLADPLRDGALRAGVGLLWWWLLGGKGKGRGGGGQSHQPCQSQIAPSVRPSVNDNDAPSVQVQTYPVHQSHIPPCLPSWPCAPRRPASWAPPGSRRSPPKTAPAPPVGVVVVVFLLGFRVGK